ncbi:MAG TPA: carboxypeptidase-like regulatory domain-containing protein, partial [Gemmatimonadaceae bacterium]|nr:carboxypeptidase-like regulatory domain-containing protein [Gemmatimonadaceae bacterium]
MDSTAVAPVAGATVLVAGTTRESITDDSGRFVLPDVPPGRQVIRVKGPGYRLAERVVEVTAGDTARIEVA